MDPIRYHHGHEHFGDNPHGHPHKHVDEHAHEHEPGDEHADMDFSTVRYELRRVTDLSANSNSDAHPNPTFGFFAR